MTISQLIQRAKETLANLLSRPRTHNFFLFSLVFFSTTQLTKHFWPPDAYLFGLPIDYLSPKLTFLDLLCALYLILYAPVRSYKLRALSPLLIILSLNLFFSSYQLITLVFGARLLLYILTISKVNWSIHGSIVSSAIFVAIMFQLSLSILQFTQGQAIQGIFYWFGERDIRISSPAVAKTSLFGNTYLRSYGTFSHPNVLAGWLISALIALTMLNPSRIIKTTSLILTIPALFFTFSRAATLALLLFLITPLLDRASITRRVIALTTLFLILLVLLPYLARDPISISDRVALLNNSIALFLSRPLFGAGAGAALSLYDDHFPRSSLLQPDHNSLTLLLSYFGLSLTPLLLAYKRSIESIPTLPLLPLIPLILLDHYFITSTQGLWIILLLLKITYEKNNSRA